MLSMICHPEAHPLREGSPGMSRTQMHFLGSSAYGGLVRGGGALRSAFLSEASREILRAKNALQDGRCVHGLNVVVTMSFPISPFEDRPFRLLQRSFVEVKSF